MGDPLAQGSQITIRQGLLDGGLAEQDDADHRAGVLVTVRQVEDEAQGIGPQPVGIIDYQKRRAAVAGLAELPCQLRRGRARPQTEGLADPGGQSIGAQGLVHFHLADAQFVAVLGHELLAQAGLASPGGADDHQQQVAVAGQVREHVQPLTELGIAVEEVRIRLRGEGGPLQAQHLQIGDLAGGHQGCSSPRVKTTR